MAKNVYTDRDALMQAFCQGSEQAFDEVFHELFPALCFYGGSFTDNTAVAEDIVQESFVKIWERRHDFTHFLVLKSFLYSTVRNACLNWLKQQKRQLATKAALLPLQEQQEASRMEQVIKAETYRALHAAIDALPAKYRDVIMLSYLHGKTGQQIADQLRIEHTAVRAQKRRGVLLLKKRLGYS